MTQVLLLLVCCLAAVAQHIVTSSYVEASAVNSLNLDENNSNNDDNKDGKWHPSVAFKCGFRNKYLDKNGDWVTDSNKYATCMKGKRDILKYCKHVYPKLDITNIVEDTHYHKVSHWCKPSGKPCKWTHTVRPYKCIAGEFESEALLVPQGCHFGHVDGRAECNDFGSWEKKTHDECLARENGMLVRSFALLAPCGLDMYSGVEFVCCPKKAEETEPEENQHPASHLLGEDKESRGPQQQEKPASTTVRPADSAEGDEKEKDAASSSNKNTESFSNKTADNDDDNDDDPYYDDDDVSNDEDDDENDIIVNDGDSDEDDDDEDYDDEDEKDEYEDQSKESNEQTKWEEEEDEDPYFRVADPENEHDNYKAAEKRLEQRHRARVNRVMTDWAGITRRYQTMKTKDPEVAEQYKKDNMKSFQKTIRALEEENRDERRQLDEVHQERVQATLNERKRATIKEYRDALAESIDVLNPHKVLKTLEQYIRSEEKDRRHSLNRFKHLLKTGDSRSVDYEMELLRKLRDIDLRINGTIAMLQDLPKIQEKVHPVIIVFWKTFRKENSPDVQDESVIGIQGQAQNRRLVQHFKSIFQQPIQVTEYPDKDLYWHYNIGSQIYSKKVFVGGLPIDINEAEIQGIFGRYGKMFVDWPYKQNPLRFNYPNKSTGYVFLIYENEESVHTLVKHCSREGRHRLYLTVSSPTMKDKPVQVRPWRIADADFLDLNQFEPLNPKNTVFVGAVPRPMKSVELAHSMNETYGSVAYAGIDTDAEYYYPKGSGRVVFNCQQSYLTAISQRYVQLKIGEIDKRVEVKPYVMEGQACSVCKGSRSGSSDAPYFCAQVPCLDYFCEQCWADAHSVNNVSHQPFVKDTNTRNRTRY